MKNYEKEKDLGNYLEDFHPTIFLVYLEILIGETYNFLLLSILRVDQIQLLSKKSVTIKLYIRNIFA